MIAVICIDDRGGMSFNRRRQSQDRLLRQDLLREAGSRPVWMSGYSLRPFPSPPANLRPAEDFYRRAGAGELCFFENTDPVPHLASAEGLILYHWNRVYPSDLRLPLPLEGWTMSRREEFPGSSHERITKEVFIRQER